MERGFDWGVAAGVTDGIGKAYLTKLAEKGFRKFALIGRSRKKLDGIQRFLGFPLPAPFLDP